MPELPEVETLRRSLEHRLIGARVTRVCVRRRDVITTHNDPPGGYARNKAKTPPTLPKVKAQELLSGATIRALRRHGKQLLVLAEQSRKGTLGFVVHLGMSGRFFLNEPREYRPLQHDHVVWNLHAKDGSALRLIFRDPRRFGGIRTVRSLDDLCTRVWHDPAPDALSVTPEQLSGRAGASRRAVKAVLLDQRVLAGVGNIYADESLFHARLHPRRPANTLDPAEWSRLAASIRRVLAQAVQAGGSTLRDFVDGNGMPGGYQSAHAVYARTGLPCVVCSTPLQAEQIAQRTSVWCPVCQPA